MTTYRSTDGFTLVEDRDMQIGSPGQQMDRVVGHPIDVYRRRFPDQTADLDDLQVLALWHVAEVDRRLNGVGLPATREIRSFDADLLTKGSLGAAAIDGWQRASARLREIALEQPWWLAMSNATPHNSIHDYDRQAPPAYPRPYVRRVNTEHGSHIEPPLDQSWSDLRKLRWWAAVAEVDAGIHGLEVHVARSTTNGVPNRGRYDIRSRGRSGGIGTFDGAWHFLTGIVYGADIIRDHTEFTDEVRT